MKTFKRRSLYLFLSSLASSNFVLNLFLFPTNIPLFTSYFCSLILTHLFLFPFSPSALYSIFNT